ncbi:hypothetical protein OEZ86_001738 [Tetradesmus obliquus]|nr:hypothetical protein OEZ86_001738 [Tetradesmus obliquus]
MNTLLLRTLELKKSPSVQTFAQYRESESQNCRHTSVTSEGELLEHQTLELRVHPPNVTVDNESYDDRTIITVDSANRPGTLVEVVQCLTELGLNVKRARISSDGGWFVDEFHVTETAGPIQQGRKVTSESKLRVIKAVLNVEYEPESEHDSSQHGPNPTALARQTSDTFDEVWQHSTVFEMAGVDRTGLLADVLQLLTINGCDVRSAAVWTYSGRVAFVVSVVEGCGQQPVRDVSKLHRLKQLLHQMMDACGNGIVNAQPVKGLIHYERRLHQLMLKEEEKEWMRNKDAILQRAGIFPPDSSCSCSCHQQGSMFDAAAAAAANGRLQNGGGMSGQQLYPQLAGNGGAQQPYSQQLAAAGGRCGGCSSCCCQEEQQELHIVRSDPQAALAAAASSQGPGQPHHSPSSSISSLPPDADLGPERLLVSPKFSRPDVTIQHYSHLNYWLVTIRCKDRNKLFFDTVCTLSDLNYDVYHGAIDSEGEMATQLYYIRPRFGDFFWDSVKATKLRVMLEAAIQRRFPKGLKVHVRHMPTAQNTHLGQNWLADLTAAWKEAGLWITRAKVRAYGDHGHTLYVMDSNGQPPDPRKVSTTG